MNRIKDSILETVGNTPVVRIGRLAPDHVELYAKLEFFNPLGSVKDRMALGVIETAERSGALQPGQTVIEATSGNTGIGLAMVCARKGYPLVIVMAENFSIERRKLIRYLGAKVILTPAADKGTGMVAKARELAEAHGWFWCRQFENEANADAHARTTAREIMRDLGGTGPDYFVTGFGTGGTLKGVARVLRAESPGTVIAVAEPDNSAMLASGTAQSYRADGTPAASHSGFRPHLMQGWSPDFIPKLANDARMAGHIDRIVPVPGAEALRLARELARQEGIFCGISGGATFAAALELARTAHAGSRILFMVPDTGERYLSTPLFERVGADMDDEETAIATSTPSHRFDTPSRVPAQSGAAGPLSPQTEAATFIDREINDPDQPVVIFALEWCEFCWSLRRFFRDLGISYRSIDLDSVAFQQGGLGGDIRTELRTRLGTPTIPQVFVAGEHLGGCVETLDAWNDGDLRRRLERLDLPFEGEAKVDAKTYLPNWLHGRSA